MDTKLVFIIQLFGRKDKRKTMLFKKEEPAKKKLAIFPEKR